MLTIRALGSPHISRFEDLLLLVVDRGLLNTLFHGFVVKDRCNDGTLHVGEPRVQNPSRIFALIAAAQSTTRLSTLQLFSILNVHHFV